ncbi:MAG: cytochrome c maturation protein CcmE [Alphaproteobacteria bacterium]|nr:cytochrome c maturation protein CcmE [Alphaproteobacteria bacterium]
MKRKHKRLIFVVIGMAAFGIAAGLIVSAFDKNLVFFFSPTEMQGKEMRPDQRIRIGGLVEEGSLAKEADGVTVRFRVTDLTTALSVSYKGLLPDLFREGQGVVAEGHMRAEGVFEASEVLAKHDENYMPREVAEALKKSGQWKGQTEAAQ